MSSEKKLATAFDEILQANATENAVAMTVLDYVEQCLPSILKARRQRRTWDEIAQTLEILAQRESDLAIEFNARTVAQYYYRLAPKPSKRCHPRQSKHHREDVIPLSAEVEDAEPLEQFNHSTSELETKADEVEPQKRASSSRKHQPQKTRFNLSSRPGAKPIKIL